MALLIGVVICLEAVLEVRNVVVSLAEIGCVRHRKFRPSLEIFNLAECLQMHVRRPDLGQRMRAAPEFGRVVPYVGYRGVWNPGSAKFVQRSHATRALQA